MKFQNSAIKVKYKLFIDDVKDNVPSTKYSRFGIRSTILNSFHCSYSSLAILLCYLKCHN